MSKKIIDFSEEEGFLTEDNQAWETSEAEKSDEKGKEILEKGSEEEILNHLQENFLTNPVMFRVFNRRSNITVYELHKGNRDFMFKSDFGIDYFNKVRCIKLIKDLKVLVKNSNFLSIDFQLE